MGSWNALGDIDLATAPTFAVDLRAMIDAAETQRVRVDCSSITFIDTSGYQALVAASRHARARQRTLVITDLALHHARVIGLCDWEHGLTLEPQSGGPRPHIRPNEPTRG